MKLERYSLTADLLHESYEFLSEGPKGTIRKVIQYEEVNPGVYNLAFGDWDEKKQRINDKSRTNNEDRDKVLATVAGSVVLFMEEHPDATVIAMGETPAKTRLYQMGLNQNRTEINALYNIVGFRSGAWEPFRDDRNYEAFSLQKK